MEAFLSCQMLFEVICEPFNFQSSIAARGSTMVSVLSWGTELKWPALRSQLGVTQQSFSMVPSWTATLGYSHLEYKGYKKVFKRLCALMSACNKRRSAITNRYKVGARWVEGAMKDELGTVYHLSAPQNTSVASHLQVFPMARVFLHTYF